VGLYLQTWAFLIAASMAYTLAARAGRKASLLWYTGSFLRSFLAVSFLCTPYLQNLLSKLNKVYTLIFVLLFIYFAFRLWIILQLLLIRSDSKFLSSKSIYRELIIHTTIY
jgi:hypothetical protein